MVSSGVACAIHLPVIDIASTIANLAMVFHIWKNRKTSKKIDLLFAALGLSNFSFTIYMIVRFVTVRLIAFNDTKTSLFEAVSFGLYTILSDLHLSLNVAIAYSRFCAVAQPRKYSEEKERSRLLKRLIAITVVGSLTLGMANGIVLGFVQIRLVRNWIEAASRFITYVLLCIIYVKIFRKVKAHNQSVANAVSTEGQVETNSISERHQNHEKYLMKLFLGITISFLVFNLPIMIIGPLTPIATGCDLMEGKLITSAFTFFIVGKAFDPMWYFFLWKRSNRRQPVQRNPQEMEMANS